MARLLSGNDSTTKAWRIGMAIAVGAMAPSGAITGKMLWDAQNAMREAHSALQQRVTRLEERAVPGELITDIRLLEQRFEWMQAASGQLGEDMAVMRIRIRGIEQALRELERKINSSHGPTGVP